MVSDSVGGLELKETPAIGQAWTIVICGYRRQGIHRIAGIDRKQGVIEEAATAPNCIDLNRRRRRCGPVKPDGMGAGVPRVIRFAGLFAGAGSGSIGGDKHATDGPGVGEVVVGGLRLGGECAQKAKHTRSDNKWFALAQECSKRAKHRA